MSRWEPNAHDRLVQAAMKLFRARGYAGTTVQEIAARAGLTERTFFRYFTDKREVLFSGSETLTTLMVTAVASADPKAPTFDVVVAAIEAVTPMMEERREHAKERQSLVQGEPELRERELHKMTSLGAAIAGALRERGALEPGASLAAEAGIAVFKIAFERWVGDPKRRDLTHHIRAARDELRAVVSLRDDAPPAVTSRARRTRA